MNPRGGISALGVATAVALLAAALAAPAAPAAATRAEFIAQAEPVCQQANEETKRQLKQLKPRIRKLIQRVKRAGPGEGGEILDVFTQIFVMQVRVENRLFEQATQTIAAIPPPPGDETRLITWLVGRQQATDLVWQAIRAAKRRRPNLSLRFLDQSVVVLRQAQQPVQAYGLNHCFIELPVL